MMRRKFFFVARNEAATQRWTMRSCRDRKRSAFAVNLARPAFTNLLGRDYTFEHAQGGLMPQRLSQWVQKARARWPRSFRNKGESGIFGEGRYAVLTCAFFHTSACRMMYSEVHLFESLEEAQNYKDGLDDFGRSHGTASTDTYCHAATKGLCSGNLCLLI
jgi:hypothetical protein